MEHADEIKPTTRLTHGLCGLCDLYAHMIERQLRHDEHAISI